MDSADGFPILVFAQRPGAGTGPQESLNKFNDSCGAGMHRCGQRRKSLIRAHRVRTCAGLDASEQGQDGLVQTSHRDRAVCDSGHPLPTESAVGRASSVDRVAIAVRVLDGAPARARGAGLHTRRRHVPLHQPHVPVIPSNARDLEVAVPSDDRSLASLGMTKQRNRRRVPTRSEQGGEGSCFGFVGTARSEILRVAQSLPPTRSGDDKFWLHLSTVMFKRVHDTPPPHPQPPPSPQPPDRPQNSPATDPAAAIRDASP